MRVSVGQLIAYRRILTSKSSRAVRSSLLARRTPSNSLIFTTESLHRWSLLKLHQNFSHRKALKKQRILANITESDSLQVARK